MATTTSSALGFGLRCAFCTAILPMPSPTSILPVMVPVTTLQPPLGLGTVGGVALASSASGRLLLIDAVTCRISTARGGLPDTKIPTTTGNYGIDLLDSVAADMNASGAGRLAASIDAQLRQDERVISSTTTATLAGYILTIVILLVDGAGPFRLTVSINTLTNNLQLLGAV